MFLGHVKPEYWRTRGWHLVRRAIADPEGVGPNQRRFAAMLLQQAPANLHYHAELKIRLEEIAYGGPAWDADAPPGYKHKA